MRCRLIIQFIVFYCCLLFLWLMSAFLVANEGWKRNGFYQTPEQANETAIALLRAKHWTIRVHIVLFLMVFFYVNIPMALYQRFIKGNQHATLTDPKGKYYRLLQSR